MGDKSAEAGTDLLLRAARYLGRAAGVVAALSAAMSKRVPTPVTPAPEDDIRAAANALGLPRGLAVSDLKVAIADAIPGASDEAVLEAAARLSKRPFRGTRIEAAVSILSRLGRP